VKSFVLVIGKEISEREKYGALPDKSAITFMNAGSEKRSFPREGV
jgi:hypothetical protein